MSSIKVRTAAIRALEKRGKVTAAALVEAARDKRHPLHNDFDWNDRRAAEKHRLDRAREIIASVRVVVTSSHIKIKTIGYVRDPHAAPSEQGYVSVATLRDDRQYAEEALDAEVERIKHLLERARDFAIAVGLLRELEDAILAILRLHSRSQRRDAGGTVEQRAQTM